ncbi:uncharacterized protein O3Q21_007504 [Podargus strigoides]
MAARCLSSLQGQLQGAEAVLVRELQAQVLRYQTRCQELEHQLEATEGSLPGRTEATEGLKKVLLQLEDEHQRCKNLAGMNILLQKHLNKANEVNSVLKEDIRKLTADWMRCREELEAKESEWRNERRLYGDYRRGEQNRLLSLWQQVVTFHHHFLEMKAATALDLSELKAEQTRLCGSIRVNCSHLNAAVQLQESVTPGRPVRKDQAQWEVEQQTSQETCKVMSLQVKWDLEKKELQNRLKGLAAMEGKYSLLQSKLVVTRETLEDSDQRAQGEFGEACKQLEQLKQQLKEKREREQHITEKLQAEMQSKIKAVENRHKEEMQTIKQKMNILLLHRDALHKQVEKLTAQLAASEESRKKEATTLHQEVASLEMQLESTEQQRKDVLDERDRLQAVKEEMVQEIKRLQESVTASETRENAATHMKHCLEKELLTTLSILNTKKEEVQTQWEKIQMLQKEAGEGKALQERLTRMTTILSKREGEITFYQEQMKVMEKQKEMHKTTLDQVINDITEKKQKMESQQEQIQDLEKQQEQQKIAVSKMSKDLEEKEQEITFQAEKIRTLEEQGASQLRNLQMKLDCTTENLKEKNLKLLSLTQQIQELEKEREEVKSLHTSLGHLQAALKDRESECESQRDQLKVLQQYKEQQERCLQELHGRVENMTLSLSKKDQEFESQQKRMQEAEAATKVKLRIVHDQLRETLENLKNQERLVDIQKQQSRSYEEKAKEQMDVLHKDLESTTATLKEKDLMIESQRKVIETFQKREQDSKQQKETLQHLEMALKKKEQEILSLRKQCEACKEKHEAEKTNLHTIKLTLREREAEIGVLEKAISELQQQKEEAATHTKAIVQKLEYAESSLEAKDQEIVSLQKQSDLLRRLTSALRWKDDTKTLQKQIWKLQKWEEEEAEKRKALQERDRSLRQQQELTQQLEDERKARAEELERVTALLKQTESAEVKWKEKAQALALSLTETEVANRTLREEMATLQSRVSERDTEQCHQQAEGEPLSWSSEKRLLLQQLQCLQQVVARLELEKKELKQYNAELRNVLEQVERERRRLKRSCGGLLLTDGHTSSPADQHKKLPSGQESSQGVLQSSVSPVAEPGATRRKIQAG